MTSSPKPKTKKHLRIMNMNFQSLKRKDKLLEAIIETTEPDILIGTETWLDANIISSEIIPDYCHYDMERRDRPKDPHGGVMIAVKQSLGIQYILVDELFGFEQDGQVHVSSLLPKLLNYVVDIPMQFLCVHLSQSSQAINSVLHVV
jgi:hypothetical protein